jgi:ABC-type cobalamin/Fe3+-siderophores transport system ATPase subunit
MAAGALAEDPKLLLLDELTTFLDVEDQFGVLEAVRAVTHARRDVTAVWVTHRCASVACQVSHNGQIVIFYRVKCQDVG